MRSVFYKMLLVLIVFFTANNAYSSNHKDEVIIRGISNVKLYKEISLYSVNNGVLELEATTKLAGNRTFGFITKNIKEGLYYVGNQNYNYIMYLKPGESYNIEISDKSAIEFLGRKVSKENKALQQWQKLVHPLQQVAVNFGVSAETMTETFETYFPKIENISKQTSEFIASLNTGNEYFEDLLKQEIELDFGYYTFYFLRTPRAVHPKKEDFTPFVNNLLYNVKFDSKNLLNLGFAKRYIFNMLELCAMNDGVCNKGRIPLDYAVNHIGDNHLKGQYVVWNLKKYKTTEALDNALENINTDVFSDEHKSLIHEKYLSMKVFTAGIPATGFTLEDINGKKVSLSDFKDKVVLIDFWASWCGPCLKEVPHMKELMKEYKGKDIVFIFISVDKSKDDWLKKVAQKKLEGIQLFNKGWDGVAMEYNVTGVPRFVLIKKGNILHSVKAPRPSSPRLRKEIDKLLNEK